jgi:hypothetical protein
MLKLIETGPFREVLPVLAVIQPALGIELVKVGRADPVPLLEVAQFSIRCPQIVENLTECQGGHRSFLLTVS